MNKNTVLAFNNPAQSIIQDELTSFIKQSAQSMLKVAIEQEVKEFIQQFADEKLDDGCQRIVRNGYLPERNIKTGVGDVAVKVPRVRDKADKRDITKVKFSSKLIPKYMRRTATLDVLLPLLYLKGISTGEFQDALKPILGEQAKTVSPSVISSLKRSWLDDYHHWQKRDLSLKRYVYWWADGIYLKARMDSDKACMLIIIGADETGKKELIALHEGYRESKDSWNYVLNDLKARGLIIGANLAVGDGALGFWGALSEVYPTTKHQRCWVHKTANVLEKLPKSLQSIAKQKIHDIYLAESKAEALAAYDDFMNYFKVKYPGAVNCLAKDKDELFAFYDFPAEHWVHLRTTNPIESTFATVRHRTKKSKNCFSRSTVVSCVYKLLREAEKRWRYLNGKNRIAQVINMEKFIDGIHEKEIKNIINTVHNIEAA